MTTQDNVLTVGVSEFKTNCLSIFDALENHKLAAVVVTRRGKPIAEIERHKRKPPSLWGAMRGSVKIAPGVDLTAPVLDEPWEPERGLIDDK